MTDHVLVVEDCAEHRELIRVIFDSARIPVVFAESAEEALTLLRDFRPKLILMDIVLPRMDGLALTRKLREDSALRTIPIVGFTAQAMEGDEQQAMAAGCDGYITKPVTLETLNTKLLGWLDRPPVVPPHGN